MMTLFYVGVAFTSGALAMLVALVLLARGEKTEPGSHLAADEVEFPDGTIRRFSSVERAEGIRRQFVEDANR
jgi:hypothetical protein